MILMKRRYDLNLNEDSEWNLNIYSRTGSVWDSVDIAVYGESVALYSSRNWHCGREAINWHLMARRVSMH